MPEANVRRQGMGNPDSPGDGASAPPCGNVRRQGMANPDWPLHESFDTRGERVMQPKPHGVR